MNAFGGVVRGRATECFLPERKPAARWALAGQAGLLGVVAGCGWSFHRLTRMPVSDGLGVAAVQGLHLVCPEAGRVGFGGCGDFMRVLPGPLRQVPVPFSRLGAARLWAKARWRAREAPGAPGPASWTWRRASTTRAYSGGGCAAAGRDAKSRCKTGNSC